MTFLAMVARTKGRVLQGGIPDKVMAARLVLKDWNRGKIPYYSVPPTTTTTTNMKASKTDDDETEDARLDTTTHAQ
jgi:nuclear GTP-binding protein